MKFNEVNLEQYVYSMQIIDLLQLANKIVVFILE